VKITFKLQFETATKNTYKYREVLEDPKQPYVDTQYIKKHVMPEGPVKVLLVTIETEASQ